MDVTEQGSNPVTVWSTDLAFPVSLDVTALLIMHKVKDVYKSAQEWDLDRVKDLYAWSGI